MSDSIQERNDRLAKEAKTILGDACIMRPHEIEHANDIQAVLAELDKCREALEFFKEPLNYCDDEGCALPAPCDVMRHGEQRASEALTPPEPQEKDDA